MAPGGRDFFGMNGSLTVKTVSIQAPNAGNALCRPTRRQRGGFDAAGVGIPLPKHQNVTAGGTARPPGFG